MPRARPAPPEEATAGPRGRTPHRVVKRPSRTQASAKCAARGASWRGRRPSRLKSPRWRSLERSIATRLTPSPLTIVQIEPRASPSAATNGGERGEAGPVGTRGCRLDSARGAARRGSARPNRAPQRAQRETASRAACGASRPRPWLLERTSALPALWTCRRRAMLNRPARDATGIELLPTTRHRGVASHVS